MIDFKEIARVMLEGFAHPHPGEDKALDLEAFYTEKLGDKTAGQILALFGHWSNDLISIFGNSPTIRLALDKDADGKFVVVDVPPPPSDDPDWYWFSGSHDWDNEAQDLRWKPGRWEIFRELQEFEG